MSTVSTTELSAIVRSAPSVPSSLTCRETLRVMFQHPEAKCIVVCNKENTPVGLIMCDRFFLKATGRHGMDHFYRESITKLMNRTPLTADLAAPLEAVALEALSRPEAMRDDCIIVTKEGQFAGVLYPSDLPRRPQ